MDKRTHIAQAIYAAGEKVQYDNEVKQIFRNKTILAWILKHTTKEFTTLSIDVITECIEGEPEIDKVKVYPGHASEVISGSDTSDKVIGEGGITYDVRFYAVTPDEKRMKLLLNIEAQKDYYPGYDLVTRGIFYASRMISGQLDTEFTADDYDGLKKVYSIWICMNVPQYARSTITEYSISPKKIYGEFKGNARYDLLSVIMVCLGNKKEENELLGMLSALLSTDLRPQEKESILQEYGIETTRQLKEEVENMCNLSDLIEEKGMEKGIKQGKEQGIQALVESFKEMGLSKESACCKIKEKFTLEEDAAQMYVEKYWK